MWKTQNYLVVDTGQMSKGLEIFAGLEIFTKFKKSNLGSEWVSLRHVKILCQLDTYMFIGGARSELPFSSTIFKFLRAEIVSHAPSHPQILAQCFEQS